MTPDYIQILRLVQNYLPDFEPYGDPERLSGGNLNLVWRVTGRDGSVIVKHAPPYIASNPEIPMNSNRLMFEATALEAFLSGGSLSKIAIEHVKPPGFLGYDEKNSFLLMEDVSPAKPWFDAIKSGEAGPESAIGLGQFIGELHSKTYSNTFFADRFDNRPVQETRYRVQYRLLSDKLAEKHDDDDDASRFAAKKCEELGSLLLQPGRCLIMGDLWPPSLLWSSNKIRIIDWEFTHFGRPLHDLAHFCAHCIMHQAVASPKQAVHFYEIWKCMIEGYRQATGRLYSTLLNNEEKRWFTVHTSAEILARTIGAFSDGYLFAGKKEIRTGRILTDQAVNLIAGNETGYIRPFIHLMTD
jgi:5-methylthioribose kinase